MELRPDILNTEIPCPLPDKDFLAQFDLDHLCPETQTKFQHIFLDLCPTFAMDPTDIGKTNLVTMNIPMPPNMFAFQ
jgi:hypothetical protein